MARLEIRVRVGKRRAIYIPARVARELDISEGDFLTLRVEGNSIILIPAPKLLVKREKWAETTIEEIESASEKLSEEMGID